MRQAYYSQAEGVAGAGRSSSAEEQREDSCDQDRLHCSRENLISRDNENSSCLSSKV